MKNALIILLATFAPLVMTAQEGSAVPPALATALGKGDVPGIGAFLADKVEVAVGSDEKTLSRADAQSRLREFYASHAAKSFKSMHSGNSKSQDSNYHIGELATDQGTYRVYLYFTQQNGAKVISELRLEK